MTGGAGTTGRRRAGGPWTIALALALPLAACTHSKDFRPARGDRGVPAAAAAVYVDVALGGVDSGDVKVWSRGVRPVALAGAEEEPRVHIGLRMRNDTATVWYLQPADMGLVLIGPGGGEQRIGPPAFATGPVTAPAMGAARQTAWFELPAETRLKDVAAYEFNWAVTRSGERDSHSTTFVHPSDGNGGYGRPVPSVYWYWGPAPYGGPIIAP